MNIANNTILITGASRGIGSALVMEALKRGAKKVYAGTRGSLQIPDERAAPVSLDVTSHSEIQHAAGRVHTLDVLINDAGISLQDNLSDPRTETTRDLELPKASPESVAAAIFDGVQNGDENIFPDSFSQSIAEGWRTGVVKALERQFTAFVAEGAANLG